MLGLCTNFANILEKREKDRLRYTNKVNCEGEMKISIPHKLIGMHEALEKNFDWIVPENLLGSKGAAARRAREMVVCSSSAISNPRNFCSNFVDISKKKSGGRSICSHVPN
jgi:hypothetical protein